jgi:hypothetical protein
MLQASHATDGSQHAAVSKQHSCQQSASSSKIQTEENKAPSLTTQEQHDFNTT